MAESVAIPNARANAPTDAPQRPSAPSNATAGPATGAEDGGGFLSDLRSASDLLAQGAAPRDLLALLDGGGPEQAEEPGEIEDMRHALFAGTEPDPAEAIPAEDGEMLLGTAATRAAGAASAASGGGGLPTLPSLQAAPAPTLETARQALEAAADTSQRGPGSDDIGGGIEREANALARLAGIAGPDREAPVESFQTRIDTLVAADGQKPAGDARPDAARILPELPVRNEAEIVQQTRVLLDRGGGRARIQLEPPQLGGLGIRLVVTDAAVQLEFAAERLPVAELLSRHLPELRAAFESHGLQIDRVQVDARDWDGSDGFGPPRDGLEHEQGERPGRSPRGPAATPWLPGHMPPRPGAVSSLGLVDIHV